MEAQPPTVPEDKEPGRGDSHSGGGGRHCLQSLPSSRRLMPHDAEPNIGTNGSVVAAGPGWAGSARGWIRLDAPRHMLAGRFVAGCRPARPQGLCWAPGLLSYGRKIMSARYAGLLAGYYVLSVMWRERRPGRWSLPRAACGPRPRTSQPRRPCAESCTRSLRQGPSTEPVGQAGESRAALHAMQVRPTAGCGCMWLYQRLQSLHAAGDGLISPSACSPSCSPTAHPVAASPSRHGIRWAACHYCQAAAVTIPARLPGASIRWPTDERSGDHGIAVDLVRCR